MTLPATELDKGVGRTFEERRWALDALASLGDGVLIADERARLVYFNPAAVRLVGANRLSADPLGWSLEFGIYLADEQTPVPPADLPLVRALAGEPVQDVEIFVRNRKVPDGIHISCSGFPLRDESGLVRGATVIFHDITARRTQQLQLQEAERQKRAILDNIPDIAWLKDREGRYVAVNTPLANAIGRKRPEDVIGLTDLDLWPRELAEQYRADDAEVMRTRLPKRVEEQLVDGTGAFAGSRRSRPASSATTARSSARPASRATSRSGRAPRRRSASATTSSSAASRSAPPSSPRPRRAWSARSASRCSGSSPAASRTRSATRSRRS